MCHRQVRALLAVVKILSGGRSESRCLMIFAASRNRSASSQNGGLTVSMGGAVGKLLSKSCSGGLNAEFTNGIPARFGLMRVGCEY